MKHAQNVAILTSANSGLAHYVLHMFEPLKKYVNPYYVTYSNALLDDLVEQKVKKVYPLIENGSASSILMTKKFFAEKNISVINLHIGTTAKKFFFHYTLLIAQAKLAGIKVIGTMHDVMPFESLNIDPAAIELLYSGIDHYVVGNESEYAKLQLYFRIPDKNITIIDHGPYTLFDTNKYSKESARKHLQIPPERRVVLFFGLLRPYKGLKYLIKAFRRVVKEVPDALLYIVSDLRHAPHLNEFLQRVEKAGIGKYIQLVKEYVPSSEIEPIYKAADIVVMPYTQVSQSGILNLAYGFKKPMIVTDVFPEASQIDRRFGRVAKAADVTSLERSIIDLLRMDQAKLQAMGSASYRWASKANNWEKAAEKMYTVIRKITPSS